MTTTNLYPGDTVVVKVWYGKIVDADSTEFEQTRPFDIVCRCDHGFFVLVPRDLYLAESFVLNEFDCKEFGLPPKFIDGIVHFISRRHVVSVRTKMYGLACANCGEHNDYASVNRLDENGNGIFICYLCRTNVYR